ncbi:MAG: nucleotidyltransferase family protein [Acidobacteria bacterium]|nr:nucleotidyltransferase family protein [Acidobacteriota bacterium]
MFRPAETDISDEHRWAILQRRAQEVRAVEAFSIMRSYGIEPVLIKGLAAAYFYPSGQLRMSVDMDLAVSAKDHSLAKQICFADVAGLAIDLHDELRHLDTVPWPDLFSNSVTVDIDGAPIRFLRPEDHLRVLCLHWLTDGGVYKDRLWDVYYIVSRRERDFDWDRVFDPVSPRRQRWLKCVLGLAEKYLGLDLDRTPAAGAAATLPQWLIRTVEKEWSEKVPLIPLGACLGDRKMLFQQFARRLPPNPIQATIDMEGDFDTRSRLYFQVASSIRRSLHLSRLSPQRLDL